VQIDRYQILDEIARGGMGVVLRARDPAVGRDVAIKVLLGGGLRNATSQKRFAREAKGLARVSHPNVVRVHAYGIASGGEPYIVMELLDGESLEQRLEREGTLKPDEAVSVVTELCGAVAACHVAGVLHRDLKPDNVVVTQGGTLKLTDFGLVRDVDPSVSRTQLTQTGIFLGTPGYWAPEQASGGRGQVGVRTDVYGLGAVLFALLTNRPPNGEGTLIEVLSRTREPKPAPSTFNPQVPSWLDSLVGRALAIDPEDRFTDLDELVSALARGGAALVDGPRPGHSRGLGVGVGVLVLLLVLALLAALTSTGRETPFAARTPAAIPEPVSPGESGVTQGEVAPETEEVSPEGGASADDGGAEWFRLGASYEKGQNGEPDYLKAHTCFRKAADAGHPDGMFSTGLHYSNGRGVEQDHVEAARWYRKAADAGLSNAMYTLALVYHEGQGVKQDFPEAIRWSRKAADAGHTGAMVNLGQYYALGEGVTQNSAEGVRWWRTAAEAGEPDAMFNLGHFFALRDGVTQDYAEAARWYRKAADAGIPGAMYYLGDMYQLGKGVTQDYVESVRWYRKGADAANSGAMASLGLSYYHGQGVEQDYAEAERWFRKAADAGDARAMYGLGFLYLQGHGVTEDSATAARWVREAADAGNAKAMCSLGSLYAEGRGVARDLAEAARWYRKAADAGNAEAEVALKRLGK
jgi:uncharacterized protein